jgi:hypothetical protein
MKTVQQNKSLPSCKVTKSLVQEIERYMLGFPEEGGNFQISVEDDLGTETFHSSSELREKFLDSVKAVTLYRRRFYDFVEKTARGQFSLSVSFNRDGSSSRMEVETANDQARERADGFTHGLLRLLEPHRTHSSLFHPNPFFEGAFFALTPVLLMLAVSSFSWSVPPWVAAIVVAVALLFTIYRIGAWLNPYTAFSSRRTERRERVWVWVVSGLSTFAVFSTVLAALRRKWLGY